MPYSQSFGLNRSSPLNMHKRGHYTNKPDDWNTWAPWDRPAGYSLTGAKLPNGKPNNENKFTEEELETASKISENKKSQAMLEGGEKWENSKYNKQPKKGFDDQGNAMTLHDGEKITRDGEDITESYNRKLSGKLSGEDKLDNVQTGLGVGGFTPGYGFFSDSANAILSGGRGIASMFGVGDKSAGHHFEEMFKSGTYAAPIIGDIKALDKVNKYARGLNQFTRSSGKTYQAGKRMTEMFKPNSKIKNLVRGAASWAVQKNKDTKLGNKIKQMFGKDIGGTIAAATSSKGLVKGPEAFNTLTNFGDNVSSAIQPFAAQAASNISPFMPTPTIASKESSPPAQSIIEKNNQESATKT